jgi:hypothetical protein
MVTSNMVEAASATSSQGVRSGVSVVVMGLGRVVVIDLAMEHVIGVGTLFLPLQGGG